MRNWNATTKQAKRFCLRVLSLPMRNWNGSSCNTSSFLRLSFEPTYEELKLDFPSTEERNDIMFWAYLWGIETSFPKKHVPSADIVLSLPMRNWNFSFFSSFSRPWKFWAYLWGIETRHRWKDEKTGKGVLSLPMRNWNSISICLPWNPFFVLSLPMRNWNGISQEVDVPQENSFEPTYEELKHND